MPSSRDACIDSFFLRDVLGAHEGWCMLPSTIGHEAFDALDPSQGWIAQRKLDGHRLIVGRNRVGDVFAATRNGLDPVVDGRLPWLAEQLHELPPGTALDGELIAPDGVPENRTYVTVAGVMKSEPMLAAAKQRMEGVLRFAAFDVLFSNGDDHRNKSLEERMWILHLLLGMFGSPIGDDRVLFPLVQEPVRPGLAAEWISEGAEGAIAKRLDAPYTRGRSRKNGWHRVKAHGEEDMVVMGFTEARFGKGGKFFMPDGTPMIGAVRLGQFRDGVLTERCQASGMRDELRVAMTMDPEDYNGRVAVVKHFGFLKGADGGLRHPQIRGFRTDKWSHECVWTAG